MAGMRRQASAAGAGAAAARRLPRFLVAASFAAMVGLAAPPRAGAADDVVAAPPAGRYGPPGFEGRVDYDLAAACADNARQRDAGEAHNYACFMLAEFMDAYHPGEEFTWQRSANRAFAFVGTRDRDRATQEQVFIRWQSFGDGLQWGFTEIEITRAPGADPFAIVADADARARIRDAIGPDEASRPCDVFVQRTREVMTDQRTSSIAFPAADLSDERYGVFVDGGLRFFTPAGEPMADARRQ